MRFIHLADLHIGKRVNGFSMLEDQRYILDQIAQATVDAGAQAVVIAGDVYDKAVPVVEALDVFEGFLAKLVERGVEVLVIAGNHDSAERLSFGSRFMGSGVHIARAYTGEPQVVRLSDEHGPVDFHLLPYVKPSYVRAAFPDEQIASYHDAVACALSHSAVDSEVRSVLVAHQFVTANGVAPELAGSENIVVGTVDNVDVSLFDAYDYVALGHLHGARHVGREQVRYCGSPLKYSFAEAKQRKTVTVVDLDAEGQVAIEEHPLNPLHDMREVAGMLEELKEKAADEGMAAQDYLHVTLSDDHMMDAMTKVRAFYPNVMALDFKRAVELRDQMASTPDVGPRRSVTELFVDYYREQMGEELPSALQDVVDKAAAAVKEGE